ncbi:FUSC family protein [Bacillus alkalicellulosilyticus]|uniref:FUSC family protein n=1 Tax=Alkalihalobacterium alkalicellulosilyticum TaxID=1912214 RepID=UPI000995F18A|nr:aromatic acid exporter family protein [Bacillus alkalicellulosilyticus]
MTKWIGRRVIKTGLAVFITATICKLFDLPVVFAVITAIVTTEPTAADSIKKGIIRLPAAAIGASFAIVMDIILGQSALTYAVVAMLTIVACARLKLDTGTLVATLTAVAMIPGTSDSFIFDFLTRLSGTTVGILVSTLVNFVILPPRFGPIVVKKVDYLYKEVATTFTQLISQITKDGIVSSSSYRELSQEMDKAFQLTQFQEDEWKYRSFEENEKRSFHFLQEKLHYLQQILFHIGSLSYSRLDQLVINNQQKQQLIKMSDTLADILQDPFHEMNPEHHLMKEELRKELSIFYLDNSTPLAKVYYEMYSLYSLAEKISKLTEEERVYSSTEKSYPKYVFGTRIQYE